MGQLFDKYLNFIQSLAICTFKKVKESLSQWNCIDYKYLILAALILFLLRIREQDKCIPSYMNSSDVYFHTSSDDLQSWFDRRIVQMMFLCINSLRIQTTEYMKKIVYEIANHTLNYHERHSSLSVVGCLHLHERSSQLHLKDTWNHLILYVICMVPEILKWQSVFLYNLGRLNDFIGQKCLKLKLRSTFVPTWSWFFIKM